MSNLSCSIGHATALNPAKHEVELTRWLGGGFPAPFCDRRYERFQPRRREGEGLPLLGAVAIHRRLFGDDGHQTHLGVLLFDEILAGFSLHFPAEKHLEARVERIP